MHLHRHIFGLTRFAGTPTRGIFKDVVVVPRRKTVEVNFLANNSGLTLFHWHQQLHMDFGFMTLLRYIRLNASARVYRYICSVRSLGVCAVFHSSPRVATKFRLTVRHYLYKVILMLNLDAAFSALADPTRRAILSRLAKGEATVMELAEPFAMTQPAISQHLKVLEDARLVVRRVEGAKRPRRLDKAGIDAMDQWLAMLRKTLEKNYDRLDEVLATMAKHKKGETR